MSVQIKYSGGMQPVQPRSTVGSSLFLGWPLGRNESSLPAGPNTKVLNQRLTRDFGNALKYSGDAHLVTFAPTGSGKGVGVIIPNLLYYDGPAIVIDPKGENFSVTARYRQKVLKQRVYLLDPFNAVSETCISRVGVQRERLNPLDLCKLSSTAPDMDAQMLADIFAGDSKSDDQAFWDNSAKRTISGLLAHEMQRAKRLGDMPRLSNVVDMLFADDPALAMATMLDKESPSRFVLKAVGGGLLAIDAKETRAGIISTAQSFFSLFTSGDILDSVDSSSIDLRRIQDKEDYTVYIVIPPTKLQSHSSLLKAWVCALMHSIMERRKAPIRRTLFMLDECANLGEMEILRKAVTLLRGYGLQVWMFFQDLTQLKALYENDYSTMINNCGVVQAFGLGRSSAAEPIARIVGGIRSNELLQLDARQQMLSVLPGAAKIARLGQYYKDGAFANKFDQNPLIRKSSYSVNQLIDRTLRIDINL